MGRLDTLREELLSLAGVAGAEVDAADATSPSGVRVRLQAGADARAVGVQVQRVLASHGYRSRVADGEVVATGEPAPGPPVTVPPTVSPSAGPDSVVVEESAAGVAVVVTGADGRSITESAESSEDGVARAVAAAVGRLVDGRPARLLWLRREDGGGDPIVSLLVEDGGGARRAGAAIVRGGLAHAVARAVWCALSGGRS